MGKSIMGIFDPLNIAGTNDGPSDPLGLFGDPTTITGQSLTAETPVSTAVDSTLDTSLGGAADAVQAVNKEEENKKTPFTKKRGTLGLRVQRGPEAPLVASAATQGVQI